MLNELSELFVSRIKNILETAIENNVDALVLGAFGCGAFNNPPSLVSDAFYKVLNMERYKYAFKEIVFAIKATRRINCPNIEAFRKFFR